MNGNGPETSEPLESGADAPAFASPIDELQHPELALWSANVGGPVELDLAPPAPSSIAGLDILSWNLAVGRARLGELLNMIAAGAFADAGHDPAYPLVVLAQEAYREDASVPHEAADRFHGGAIHAAEPCDVVSLAKAHGLSLRYAPSMRNGSHRSDRGNAILSTVALGTSHAFLLPYVKQRRVTVVAEVAGLPDVALASVHLDVSGQRNRRRVGRFGGGRMAQAEAVARRLAHPDDRHCLVMGADLNTPLGVRDPAIRALVTAGLHPAQRVGRWRHTFHGPVRLLLDHVLFRSPTGRIRGVRVVRLDEHPEDRTKHVFGSDHHPLLARVEFAHRTH
jgi:endonuclease/exonuclease/phosphatase family metal-dependent hydrolase